MRDKGKAKEKLINELEEIRRRTTELKTLAVGWDRPIRDLNNRDAILGALATATKRFLDVASFEEGIQEMLQRLGEATEVSRVYVFENHLGEDGTLLASQRYEWVAPGIEPQLDNPDLQNTSWMANGMGRWVEVMSQGKTVQGYVKELPLSEQRVLSAQNIKSIVAVPIFVQQDWWGFIGFDECSNQRTWSEAEMDALSMAASILGGFIQRKRLEEELRKHRDQLEKLVEGRTAELRMANERLRQEITEREGAEDTVRESEERFRALFEGALDAMFLADPESGEILDVNPAAGQLLLKPKEEIIGIHQSQLHPPYLESFVREMFAMHAQDREQDCPVEAFVLRSDGREIPVEIVAHTIQIDGKPVVYAVFRDITVRKRAEKALQESEERYRSFFDESPTALWEIDGSYVKEYTDKLRASGVRDLKAYFADHPEEALRCRKKVKVVEVNKASLALFEASSKEELLAGLSNVIPEEAYPVFAGGVLAMAEARSSFGRESIAWTLSGKKKHLYYRWVVARGYKKTCSKVLVSIVDLTDRMELEQELLKTQKLESLGVLAGGIAHDFNNLLTAISTNISMARMYGNLEGDISEILRDAEKASSRARGLTQQLLTFAKGGKPIKRRVSLSRVLVDTVEFALSGSNVESEYDVPGDLWHVWVDEGQIGQVIHNLVINAVQAMPEGGRIKIAAENVLMEGQDQIPLKEGKYVKVSVTDHGSGISKKYLNRVFDPFFTTKQKGSGLGLTTSYTIIKNHEGYIRVDSEMDIGTRVDVFLPRSEEALELEHKDQGKPFEGHGRVLLIDDEEVIRRSASEMLRRFGYDVTLAKDGTEGIRCYREASKGRFPFDAVILDLTIRGGKGGKEIVKELMKMDPDAKVIVCSGYSEDPVMSHFQEYGFRGVIAKPYGIEEVAAALRSAISRGDG